jgi:hypothetical protein
MLTKFEISCARKICIAEDRRRSARMQEIRIPKVRSMEIGSDESGGFQIRAVQIDSVRVARRQIQTGEVRVEEIRHDARIRLSPSVPLGNCAVAQSVDVFRIGHSPQD